MTAYVEVATKKSDRRCTTFGRTEKRYRCCVTLNICAPRSGRVEKPNTTGEASDDRRVVCARVIGEIQKILVPHKHGGATRSGTARKSHTVKFTTKCSG